MYILYIKPGCPFCEKVLQVVNELGLEVELKSVMDPEIREELIEHGGKKQVPYLIDTARAVAMYESDAIIAYWREQTDAELS